MRRLGNDIRVTRKRCVWCNEPFVPHSRWSEERYCSRTCIAAEKAYQRSPKVSARP